MEMRNRGSGDFPLKPPAQAEAGFDDQSQAADQLSPADGPGSSSGASAGGELADIASTVVTGGRDRDREGESLAEHGSSAFEPGGDAAQGRGQLEPGDVIDGHYQVLSLLGKGGMSFVYLVKHLTLGKLLALKVLHPYLTCDEASMERFKREGREAERLKHPNILAVFDLNVSSAGLAYLTMEYLEGRSLADLIRTSGAVEPRRAAKIFGQVCDALQYAHDHGLVHRDLKPSNIMLIMKDEESDFVKIVDFGIAKLLNTDSTDYHRLTQTGEIFGSPSYMSPEQCQGRPVDCRSDIYSMGCVMYETLTGRLPFVGDTMFEVFQKQIEEIPRDFSGDFNDARVRRSLELIVFGAMAKEPERRYQSMSRLKQDLELFLRGTGAGPLSGLLASWHLTQLRRGPRKRYVSLAAVASAAAAASLFVLFAVKLSAFSETRDYFESVLWKPADLRVAKQKSSIGQDSNAATLSRAAEELMKSMERFKGKDPSLIPRYQRLGNMMLRSGNLQKGQLYLQKAYDLEKLTQKDTSMVSVEIPMELANCFYVQGDFERAKPLYMEALRKFPAEDLRRNRRSDAQYLALDRLCDILVRERNQGQEGSSALLADSLNRLAQSLSVRAWMRKEIESREAAEALGILYCRKADLALSMSRGLNLELEISKLSEALDSVKEAKRVYAALGSSEYSALPWISEALVCERLATIGYPAQRYRARSLAAYAHGFQLLSKASLSPAQRIVVKSNYADFLWRSGSWAEALRWRAEAALSQL